MISWMIFLWSTGYMRGVDRMHARIWVRIWWSLDLWIRGGRVSWVYFLLGEGLTLPYEAILMAYTISWAVYWLRLFWIVWASTVSRFSEDLLLLRITLIRELLHSGCLISYWSTFCPTLLRAMNRFSINFLFFLSQEPWLRTEISFGKMGSKAFLFWIVMDLRVD